MHKIYRFFSIRIILLFLFILGIAFVLSSSISTRYYTKNPLWIEDSIVIISNPHGPNLGYSLKSGIHILKIGDLSFKDLNKNGILDPYEDWRLPVEDRVRDLSKRMTIEQIAGLMLYSAHQSIPANPGPFGRGTYGGKVFSESKADPSDLSDQQKAFLEKDNLRHILITSVMSPKISAQWNNKVQSFVEGIGLGIPANNSSDPRHSVDVGAEYTAGAGGKISQWPDPLGLASTFDPNITREFGHIASREYRALGISTALSPQIDLGTEPRWVRINGTFGEDPQLAADMARSYVDGFQTSLGSDEINGGWGYTSVNAMIKHWPGGGPEEGGRDAHYAYGKFAVYPGNNLDEHLIPFTKGGMNLNLKTKMASALMPYYTISYNRDSKNKANVGNSYSQYLIQNLLREQYHFDGVVCTDWGVTADEGEKPDVFKGKSWGMEKSSITERHYKIMMAGVDQFGGNNDAIPVIEAYKMGVSEHGEAFMREKFEKSAIRLLRNIMQVGLFENPYLDPQKTETIVGNPDFMKAGYEAQLKSIVLLKNKSHLLPLPKGAKVYIPQSYTAPRRDFFNNLSPEKYFNPLSPELMAKYFQSSSPENADYAIVFVSSPQTGAGYDREDLKTGGNGYVPISLQYGLYKADLARDSSLASGDPSEPGINNRSYKGKTSIASNLKDLEIIQKTRALMGNKPVIVCIALSKPMVMGEFEKDVQGILVSFGVKYQAILDILTGTEPQGLLPFQLPKDMQTVENQLEDIPHDMIPHKDQEGNSYDFGYGLNYKGIIHDSRTQNYLGRIVNPSGTIKNHLAYLTCPTPNSLIYYSLNGHNPSFDLTHLYKKPIPLKGHGTLKMMSKVFGFNNSNLIQLNY